jgi:hypothetical protein
MRAVVDFDGTIRSWKTGEAEEGVKESLTRLKEAGWTISILSCRTSLEFTGEEEQKRQKTRIETFLLDRDIPFDEVLEYDKPIADVYIDDAGIEYDGGNWKEIVDRLVE